MAAADGQEILDSGHQQRGEAQKGEQLAQQLECPQASILQKTQKNVMVGCVTSYL